jgi:DNA invertase Pin-like site-specific DNA recombinase
MRRFAGVVVSVFGVIAHFERRLIAERTKDRIAAARAHGKRPGRQPLDPDKIAAALKLVKAGLSPTAAPPGSSAWGGHRVSRGRPGRYRENPLACHLSCSWKVLP